LIVQEFKNFGPIVTDNNNMDKEFRNRIILSTKCYHGIKGKFRSYFLTPSTKLRLCKTLLRRVLIYGSESWMLTTSNVDRLWVFETKVLRRIFGPACKNGLWQI
jgi:hypothetical protein